MAVYIDEAVPKLQEKTIEKTVRRYISEDIAAGYLAGVRNELSPERNW